MNIEHRLTLETERLRLEPLDHHHAEALAPLIGDRRIADTTSNIPHPYTLADAHGFVDHVLASEGRALAWMLVRRVDDRLVGGCGLHDITPDGVDVGYWIGVPYWGSGYATEATRGLLGFAFGTLGTPRASAFYFLRNPASRRVMEKVGFCEVPEGGFDPVLRCRDGRSERAGRMTLTRDRWLAAVGG